MMGPASSLKNGMDFAPSSQRMLSTAPTGPLQSLADGSPKEIGPTDQGLPGLRSAVYLAGTLEASVGANRLLLAAL